MVKKTPRKYAPRKPRKESSPTTTVAILAVLGLVTVGLSGFALFSQGDDGSSSNGGDQVSAASTTPAGSRSSSDGDDTKSTDDGADKAEPRSAVRSDRLMAVSDDPERLLRAQGVECGAGDPTLEVSADGGQTWTQADTSMLEMAGVRQIQFGEGGRAQLAFVDQQCGLQFARSYVYGGAWEAGPGAGGIWTLSPEDDVEGLVVSGEEVEAPCTVVGTSGASERGIILCDDGTVAVSDDSGQSWSDTIAVDGAQAVASGADDFLVVSQDTDDCAGVSVRSFDGDELGDSGECKDVEIEPDQIAASVGAGSLYVWANDETLRSDDLGESWN
jgi:hypothetical protein